MRLVRVTTRRGSCAGFSNLERRKRALINHFTAAVATVVAAVLLIGCQTAYYGAMERLGVHKRDILVDRVGEARDAQQDAKQQFEDALEQFQTVVRVPGGDLQEQYQKLRGEYRASVDRADAVRERIDAVEQVAGALFAEWEDELDEYRSPELRRRSRAQLQQTQARYQRLIARMHRAEERMEPVLEAFQDQVLILKHNLNARAIAALQDEARAVEADVSALIRDMEAAIQAANRFLAEVEPED